MADIGGKAGWKTPGAPGLSLDSMYSEETQAIPGSAETLLRPAACRFPRPRSTWERRNSGRSCELMN